MSFRWFMRLRYGAFSPPSPSTLAWAPALFRLRAFKMRSCEVSNGRKVIAPSRSVGTCLLVLVASR